MSTDATRFIASRSNKTAITQKRIKEVLWYITECYMILQKDKRTYSKSWCAKHTKFHFEDYLKMKFVDDYLIENKALIQNKISALEEINFNYETIKRFIDSKEIEGSDKIDIYINKLGLQNVWKEHDEHLYFAIECKRINQFSDSKKYLEDIRKFCIRNYKQTRLPFEGMLAFLENKDVPHKSVAKHINQKLKEDRTITTLKFLTLENISTSFNGSYRSLHKKQTVNIIFSIYHLLFDYTENIVD